MPEVAGSSPAFPSIIVINVIYKKYMNKATLNLFNAIQVDGGVKAKDLMFEKTVKHGFVFAPDFDGIIDDALIQTVSDVIGISGEKANSAFHKSFKTIQDTPQETLFAQACVHYLTTYGFQSMGIYNDESIYIPNEELNIPEVTDKIKLIVVKSLTQEEILDGIFNLASGIALKEETLRDIIIIVEGQEALDISWNAEIIENIHNRELKGKLYDYFDIVPSEPSEYLRYLVNRLVDESLIIKNGYLISKIKECDSELHIKILDKALGKAPNNLAEIFFRYKPIFLALKKVSKNKTFFNQLRKKANAIHKPMPEDFLNSVTSKLKHGDKIVLKDLDAELAKVNIFRKIRLAYALKFRTKENSSIVYRVRNGRGFATEFSFKQQSEAEKILKVVIKAIGEDLNVNGERIYIPRGINYALPATEKMFTGNFPTGSYVSVPEDMIVGIYWKNTNREVDLDLSVISESGKTGWDCGYKSQESNILFSGDVTSAPKGATELFYIKEGETDANVMMVNYYNFNNGDKVDTKIIVASEEPKNFGSNYMVDPNNIIAEANITISKKQNVIGLIVSVDGENRFYFANVSIGNSISSHNGEQSKIAREYLVNSLVDSIDLKEILEIAGAVVVDEKLEDEEFIDLSPEALDKTTIINLLK